MFACFKDLYDYCQEAEVDGEGNHFPQLPSKRDKLGICFKIQDERKKLILVTNNTPIALFSFEETDVVKIYRILRGKICYGGTKDDPRDGIVIPQLTPMIGFSYRGWTRYIDRRQIPISDLFTEILIPYIENRYEPGDRACRHFDTSFQPTFDDLHRYMLERVGHMSLTKHEHWRMTFPYMDDTSVQLDATGKFIYPGLDIWVRSQHVDALFRIQFPFDNSSICTITDSHGPYSPSTKIFAHEIETERSIRDLSGVLNNWYADRADILQEILMYVLFVHKGLVNERVVADSKDIYPLRKEMEKLWGIVNGMDDAFYHGCGYGYEMKEVYDFVKAYREKYIDIESDDKD